MYKWNLRHYVSLALSLYLEIINLLIWFLFIFFSGFWRCPMQTRDARNTIVLQIRSGPLLAISADLNSPVPWDTHYWAYAEISHCNANKQLGPCWGNYTRTFSNRAWAWRRSERILVLEDCSSGRQSWCNACFISEASRPLSDRALEDTERGRQCRHCRPGASCSPQGFSFYSGAEVQGQCVHNAGSSGSLSLGDGCLFQLHSLGLSSPWAQPGVSLCDHNSTFYKDTGEPGSRCTHPPSFYLICPLKIHFRGLFLNVVLSWGPEG